MNLIYLVLPFLDNYHKNKKVRAKREEFSNQLSQIKNSDSISTDVLEKQYSDTILVKDKLEDKAKSNIIAITVSITLILGASSLLNGIYSKYPYVIVYWISFILFVLALIYMIIAGVLSIRVLMNENTIYTVSLKDYINEKDLRQEYDTCTVANINQNLIRNNGVNTSYECIRNALICLFIIVVMVVFPYTAKQQSQSLSAHSSNGYNVTYSSDAVTHIAQNNDQNVVETFVIDAARKGKMTSSTPVGLIDSHNKLFIKANIVKKSITIYLIEYYQ